MALAVLASGCATGEGTAQAQWWKRRSTTATTTTTTTPSTTTSSSTTTTTTTTTSTTTTTAVPQIVALPTASGDPSRQRFFGPGMAWNRPVSDVGVSTGYGRYVTNLFRYAGAQGWDGTPYPLAIGYDPNTRGQWNVALRDYSVPIWDAADATTTIKVFKSVDAQNQGIPWVGIAPGGSIPWNPAWSVATGMDGIAAIVDYRTGRAWELYRPVGSRDPINCFDWFGPNGSAGFDLSNPSHTCWGGVNTYTDIFTSETPVNSRGMGINKLALIVRAGEVESGAIHHALELTVFNSMFGTECAPTDPGAGTSCAFHLSPANRVEHLSQMGGGGCGGNQLPATDWTRSRTVPQGMRFRLSMSDAEITAWLDGRGLTGARRSTARVFAVALRDYGFYPGAETGCAQPHIETEGMQNPETRQRWLDLGLTDGGYDQDGDGRADFPSKDLLYGLITEDRLQVVNPA